MHKLNIKNIKDIFYEFQIIKKAIGSIKSTMKCICFLLKEKTEKYKAGLFMS
jgi:hypothetical protein